MEFYGYLGLCGKAPSLTSSFLAFPSQDLPGANVFSIIFPFYRGKPLQNRSAPHFIEGLPSFPITGAHAFLFYRGKPLQNRSVPHFIERLSEFFILNNIYKQSSKYSMRWIVLLGFTRDLVISHL